MQKFLRTLTLVALMLVPFVSQAQSVVIVGDTTSTSSDSYLPMNSLYDYSYSQQIYTADEIGMAGTINSITVWLKGNANLYEMPFAIYMTEENKSAFAGTTDWVTVTSANLVYSGSVTVHNTDFAAYTFVLTTPFVYSGEGNLVISFDNNTGNWKSGLNGKVFTATDNEIRSIYARRDGTDYDPTNMSGITATSTVAARNVISFSITPSANTCERPSTLEVANIAARQATLNWTGGSGAFNVEYKRASDTTWTRYLSNVGWNTVFYNLTPETTYDVRVQSVCGNDVSLWKTTSFTTLVSCPAPVITGVTYQPYNAAEGTWRAVYSWDSTGAQGYILYEDNPANDEPYISPALNGAITSRGVVILPESDPITVKVRAFCGTGDTSQWSAPVTIYKGYCTPNPTSRDGQGITGVAFGMSETVNNTTHPTSAPYYGDYRAMVGSVPAGLTANVDITFATGYTYGTIIWVDWNKDYEFSGDEVVYVGESTNSNPTTLTASFAIPATQDTGSYRMRIAAADSYFDSYTGSIADAANANPCASYSWGVAEDYTLHVTQAPSCLPPTDITIAEVTNNSITVTFTPSGAPAYDVHAYTSDMVDTYVTTTSGTATITGLNAGTTYYVRVQSSCGNGVYSIMNDPIEVTTAVCALADQCQVSIYAEDSYGDGWSGNTITIAQNGVTLGTYSMASQNVSNTTVYDTFQLGVCSGMPVSFSWTSGGTYSYPDEVSFQIVDGGGTAVYSLSDASNLDDGVFYTINTPCPTCIAPVVTIDSVVGRTVWFHWTSTSDSVFLTLVNSEGDQMWGSFTIPSGSVDETGFYLPEQYFPMGYTYLYALGFCGASDTSAWGMDFFPISCDAENQCPVTFVLNDVFGDGWNGGELLIYDSISGMTVANMAATNHGQQESLTSDTVVFNLCADQSYEVYITPGSYPEEIGFQILDKDGNVLMFQDTNTLSYTADTLGYFHLAPCSTSQEDVCWPMSVVIGDENSTTSANGSPVNNYYNYTLTETIIDAEEIGGPKALNGIKYYYNYATAMTAKDSVTIWLQPTTKSVFSSSTDIDVLDSNTAVMVYSGSLNCSQGWNEFTFNTPYQYNGESNLMVIIDDNSGSYNTSSHQFRTSACTGYKTLCWYSDSNNPDPTDASFSGSKAYYQYRVVMAFVTCDTATCHAPINAVASAVGANNATVTWSGMESNYSLLLSDATDIVSYSTVTDTTMTFTDLEPNTDYTVDIRALCSEYDSSTVITVAFHTECDLMATLPYSYGFEDATIGASNNPVFDAECWKHLNNATTNMGYPYISSTANACHDGSRGLYWYNYNTVGTYGDYRIAVLPGVGGNYLMSDLRLRFWAKASSASAHPVFYVGVMTDPTDITTFDTVYTVNVNTEGNTEWKEYLAYLANYTGTGRYVAIASYPEGTTWTAYVDDVTLEEAPSCVGVTNLTAAVASTEVTLNWVDQLNAAGVTYTVSDATGTPIATGITATTYTVTGLEANTDYTFMVTANCSATESGDPVSVNAHTECGSVAIPYSQNFDDLTTSTTAATGVRVECWPYTMTGSSTYQGTTYQPGVYYSSTYSNSGSYSLRLYGVSYTCLPQMSEPLNTLKLDFNAYTTGTANKLAVGVMEGETFIPVDTIELTTNTHNPVTVFFGSYNGNSRTIAFRNFNNSATTYYSTIYIDDVVVDYLPSCVSVTNLTATPESNSVTLNWEDLLNGDGVTYSVSDATGTPIATGLTATTYTVTGLTASTDYTFVVTANCSETASGDAVSVNTRTLCAVESYPFAENFDDWATKSECWSFLSGAFNNGAGTPAVSTSAWTLSTSYGNYITLSGKALTMNLYSTNRYWAVTPTINITSSTAQMTFDIAVSAWSAATPNFDADDTVAVAISTNGGASYTPLLVYDNTQLNALTGNYTTVIVPVTGYNGQNVRFAIFGGSSASGGDNRVVIDNVSVGDVPACSPVTSLVVTDVTSSSVTLAWVDQLNSGATYTVVGPTGTVATGIQGATYTVTGLDANTEYSFSVVANCSADEYSDSTSIVALTACATLTAADLPYTEDFEAYGSGAAYSISPCWTKGTTSTTAYPYPYATNAISGSRSLYFYGYKAASAGTAYYSYAALPQLDATLDASDMTLSFKARRYSTTTANYRSIIYVGVMTDPTDASTFTTVETINMTPLAGSTVETYNVDLANYTGTGKYVAFYCPSVDTTAGYSYNYVYVDDVMLYETPTCLPIAGLTASDVTANSVTLTWTDVNNEGATYTVYNGEFEVASGITGLTYTVTGLDQNTQYTLGVQANCSADDASPIMTVSARTACGAEQLPFYEDFSATLANDPCWRGASILYTEEVTPTLGNITGWAYQSSVNNGLAAGHYRVNIFGTSCKYWLFTPTIDLSGATNPALTFDAAFTVYTSTSTDPANVTNIADDKFMVLVSTNDGQSWSVANNFDLTSLASSTYLPQTVSLSQYVGQNVKIAFYAESTVSGGDNNLHIDNIAVTEATPEPDSAYLFLFVNDTTMGTTTPAPGVYVFHAGDSLEVTATPYDGYVMSAWIFQVDMPSGTITDTIWADDSYFTNPILLSLTEEFEVTQAGLMAVFEPAPVVCQTPSMTIDSVNGRDVTFSWTTNVAAYAVQVELLDADGEPVFDTIYGPAGTQTLHFDETLFDAGTAYIGMAAICGEENFSEMVIDSVELVDPSVCDDPIMLPFTETFEETSNTLECWTTDGPGNWQVGNYSSTGATYEGSRYAYIRHATNGNVTKLISPILGVSADATGIQLSFAHIQKSWTGDQDEMRVYYRTSATGNWTMAAEYTNDIQNWMVESVVIPANTYQVAFEMTDGYGYGVAVDSVVVTEMTSAYCYPANSIAAEVTMTSATLTWSGNSTSYQVTVSDGTTNVYNGVVNDTTLALTGLTAETNYSVNIYAICGVGDTSDVATASFFTGYCSPNPTSVDGNGITSVSFGGMTNTTHPTSAGYANYSSMAGSVPAGSTATLDITYATGYTYGTIVWVDWDNSLTFDSNEVVAVGTSDNTNPTTLSLTFDIPLNTTLGNYRMRILAADSYFDSYTGSITDAADANPCASYTWGVAEDYTLTVTEAPACLAPNGLVATPAAFSVDLSWNDQNNGGSTYSIYDMAAGSLVLIASNVTGTNYTVTGLSSETNYTFGVQANCSATETSDMITVSTTTLISCPVPTALNVTLTPGNGTVATLAWTAGAQETAWQICLNDDTNYIDVTTNPYTLTNLTAEQTYTAKVRAICDVNDQSAWSSTVTFTPTNAYNIIVNDGTTTNGNVPIYGLWVDDITKSQFIIPATDLAAMQYGAINKLTFYASNASVNWGAAEFNVYLTETTDSVISALADYTTMTQVYAGTLSINNNIMEVNFTTPYLYMGGNLMVGFLQTVSGTYQSCSWYGVTATGASMGGYGSSISQRNFLPKTKIDYTPGTAPSCLPVTGLTASDITATGATLTWNGDASSYNVYAIGATDTTFVQNVTTTTITLTGLTAMTNYTYGVTAVCTTDESIMMSTSFTTACSAVAIPFTEGFEATSGTLACWSVYATSNSTGIATNASDYAHTGNGVFAFSYSTNPPQFLISPELSGTGSQLQVEFDYRIMSASYPESFVVGYSTTTSDTSAFTWGTEQTNLVNETYAHYTEVLNASGIKYVAVKYTANDMYYLFIDDVVIRDVPACAAVTNLTVDSVTTTSVSLSWTDTENTGATYTVYNMADSSVVATGLTVTNYTVTGLTAATNYTFGVVANCSATEAGDFVTVAAMTACDDVTMLPYNEGFENGVFGCWTTVNGSSDGQPWNVQTAFSSGAVAPHAGTYMAASWSWNSSAMHADAWLISPKFVLPSINAGDSLTFSWWEKTNTTYPDSYSVAVSTTTNDTTSFTVVRPHTAAVGDWTMQSIDLTAYAGQSVYVAFHHVDYDENYLLIDDISLFQGAYVPPAPDTLTVTFATANAAMGTTNPAPGTYQYITGDTVHFSALPNAGYRFVGWIWEIDGDVDTLDADYISASFPVSTFAGTYDSMTFTALFEAGNPDSTTITYAVNDATMGTITPAPGTYTIYVGNAIEATATPNNGYVLDAWLFDIYLSGTLYSSDTITSADEDFDNPMFFGTLPQSFADYDATITITAVFAADTTGPQPIAMLNLTMDVNDTAMGTTIPAPGLHQIPVYDTNQSTTLWAVPNAGYSVEKWVFIGERLNGTVEYDTLTPTNSMGLNDVYFATNYTNVTYKAIFTEDSTAVGYHTYTILVNDSTMGYVSVTSGAAPHNSAVIIDAYAHDGYHFVSWSNGETNPQLIFYLTMDTTFTAYFAPDEVQETITVTFDVNDATMGTVNPSGTVELVCGSTVTVTATAFEGYENYAWKVRMGTDSTIVESNPGSVVTWEYVIPQGASAYVDNIVITAMFRTVTGIQDVDLTNVNIYSTDSRIIVNGAEGRDVTVFDVTGRVIDRKVDATDHVEFSLTNTGAYLVKVGNAPAKRVVVVR